MPPPMPVRGAFTGVGMGTPGRPVQYSTPVFGAVFCAAAAAATAGAGVSMICGAGVGARGGSGAATATGGAGLGRGRGLGATTAGCSSIS